MHACRPTILAQRAVRVVQERRSAVEQLAQALPPLVSVEPEVQRHVPRTVPKQLDADWVRTRELKPRIGAWLDEDAGADTALSGTMSWLEFGIEHQLGGADGGDVCGALHCSEWALSATLMHEHEL